MCHKPIHCVLSQLQYACILDRVACDVAFAYSLACRVPINSSLLCVRMCVRVYIHIVARPNSCKNVVLRGCGKLRGSISYFLATRSSQMNVEAANDVDPKY